jgi:hypothetical protein
MNKKSIIFITLLLISVPILLFGTIFPGDYTDGVTLPDSELNQMLGERREDLYPISSANNYITDTHDLGSNSYKWKDLYLSNTANILAVDFGTNTIIDEAMTGTWNFNSNQLYIKNSDGRIGMGTNTPNRQLEVKNPDASCVINIIGNSGNFSSLHFGDEADESVGAIRYSHTANKLYFDTNGVENRVIIDDSGQLGIGTVSPATIFEIETSSGDQTFTMDNNSHGDNAIIQFNAEDTGGTNRQANITWDSDAQGMYFDRNVIFQRISAGDLNLTIDNDQHGDNAVLKFSAEETGGTNRIYTYTWNSDSQAMVYKNESTNDDHNIIYENNNHGSNISLKFDAENAGGTNKISYMIWDPDIERLTFDRTMYLLRSDGGNPTYYFDNDSHGGDCILQFDAEDTGGTNRAFTQTWDSDNRYMNFNSDIVIDEANSRVGIGKTNPEIALDIVGETGIIGDFNVTGDIDTEGTVLASISSGTQAFFLNNTQNGINLEISFSAKTAGGGVAFDQLGYDPDLDRIYTAGDLHVTGALSKGSGSFDIPHLVPSKNALGMRLRHYFVETNSAGGNIYKYQLELIEGENILQLPDYFKYLNTNVLIWVSPHEHFGIGYGNYIENNDFASITVNSTGKYNVFIFADRKDSVAMKDFNKYGIEYTLEEQIQEEIRIIKNETK